MGEIEMLRLWVAGLCLFAVLATGLAQETDAEDALNKNPEDALNAKTLTSDEADDERINSCTDVMTTLLNQKALMLKEMGFSTMRELGSANLDAKQLALVKKFQDQAHSAIRRLHAARALKLKQARSQMNSQEVVELGDAYDEEPDDEEPDDEEATEVAHADEEDEDLPPPSDTGAEPKKEPAPVQKIKMPLSEMHQKHAQEIWSKCMDNIVKLARHVSTLLQGKEIKSENGNEEHKEEHEEEHEDAEDEPKPTENNAAGGTPAAQSANSQEEPK